MMRGRLMPLAFSVALMVSGCGANAPDDAATAVERPSVVISQVRVDRSTFDPAKGEAMTVRFQLDTDADVALAIYDGRDQQVHREEGRNLKAGEHTLRWDGRGPDTQPVPPEAYTYTLTARNVKGEVVHDLTDLTGGAPVVAKDVRWDADSGTVRYVLDRPARVSIRLGLESGPYLRTLVDWVPRTAGAHAERWDGLDASGVLKLDANPALSPAIRAVALPDNTLFVGTLPDRLQFAAERSDQAVIRPRTGPDGPRRMFDHARQPLDTRGDISAMLKVGGGFKQDEEGRWLVSGKVPLTVDVAAEDRELAIQRRFEAVFYVDGVFTHENELGYLPLNWTWDTSRFNPGEHFVTINIRGYEGNFGTATIKALILPVDGQSGAASTQESP